MHCRVELKGRVLTGWVTPKTLAKHSLMIELAANNRAIGTALAEPEAGTNRFEFILPATLAPGTELHLSGTCADQPIQFEPAQFTLAAAPNPSTEAAEILKSLADFTTLLEKQLLDGEGTSFMTTMNAAMLGPVQGLIPFTLKPTTTPTLSAFITAANPLQNLHRFVKELSTSLSTLEAEIFLVDDSTCPDAALLPLIIPNLRYLRSTTQNEIARYNDLMRLGDGPLVLLAKPAATIPQNLAETLTTISANPQASTISFANTDLILICRSTFITLGGFDETATSLDAALGDFIDRTAAEQLVKH